MGRAGRALAGSVLGSLLLASGSVEAEASTKIEAIAYIAAWRMYVTNHCQPWQIDPVKARAFLPDFPRDEPTKDAIQHLATSVYAFMKKRGSVSDRCSEAINKFGPSGWNVLYRDGEDASGTSPAALVDPPCRMN